MEKHPENQAVCPLAAVDRRLDDAHRFWHQAEAAYFDPDGFRIAIQSAIQTLRTVTFILQKQKAIIPQFDQWYSDWQRRLSADLLMKWMVDARNKIEKEGDLESHSMIRADVVASYLDEGPGIDVPAHLTDSIGTLLHSIPRNALGDHIRCNGMLRIQRRWVENTLPDFELLDSVATAYGRIAQLVHDAHRQIGLDPPATIHDEDGMSYDLSAMNWRLPCMVAHELPRTVLFSLADGSRVAFDTRQTPVEFDAAAIAKLTERYGGNPLEAMRRGFASNVELAAGFFGFARNAFLRDGYHLTLLLLFRDRRMIRGPIQVVVENVQQKYAVMRELAGEVTKSGADVVIMIGEMWLAPADALKPYERPADYAARKEGLALHMVSKAGESLDCIAEITRNGDKVLLGETQVATGAAAFEFAPFLQAWGSPVPQSWMKQAAAAMAMAKHD